MKRKRIFIVSTRFLGSLSPFEFLIPKLNDKGYEVFVFGQRDPHYKMYFHNNCRLVEINSKRKYFSPFSDLFDVLKITFYSFWFKPQFIHTLNPKPTLLTLPALLIFNKIKFFFVVTGLGNSFVLLKDGFLKNLIFFGFNVVFWRCNKVSFQNKDDMNFLTSIFHIDADKHHLFIGPGVNTKRFSPIENVRAKCSDKKLRVLYVGRLLWQKGVGDLFNTIRRLEEENLSSFYAFSFVGELDNDHPDRVDRESLLDVLERDNVQWLAWTDSIELQYRWADVVLFMSHREGAPRAVLEAAAMEVPSIGSNAPGVRDVIIDGVTGRLCEIGDVESIVKFLEAYRLNRHLVHLHGRQARKQIAERWSLIAATEAQMSLYRGLM